MTDDLDSALPALEFRVLGPLVVLRAGSTVRLGGIRQRAVLARLICNAGRVVTTDQIADGSMGRIGPNVDTCRHCRPTFSIYARRLSPTGRPGRRRRCSGRRPAVIASIWTLIGRRSTRADSRRRRPPGAPVSPRAMPGPRLTELRAALALWHGDVLADLRDFEFVGAYADRLNGLFVDTEEARLDAELALGNHAAVADAAASLIENHGLRERFHAQRMLALYRCGRQAEALSAYTRLRQLLVDELGIEPNQQVQELHRMILDQDPELDWQPTSASPAIETAGATPAGARPQQHRTHRRRAVLAVAAATIIAIGTISAVVWHNSASSELRRAHPTVRSRSARTGG